MGQQTPDPCVCWPTIVIFLSLFLSHHLDPRHPLIGRRRLAQTLAARGPGPDFFMPILDDPHDFGRAQRSPRDSVPPLWTRVPHRPVPRSGPFSRAGAFLGSTGGGRQNPEGGGGR